MLHMLTGTRLSDRPSFLLRLLQLRLFPYTTLSLHSACVCRICCITFTLDFTAFESQNSERESQHMRKTGGRSPALPAQNTNPCLGGRV